MAGTNPIIDLATINDLQTRLAAIESALGKYNAANAVTAASQVPPSTSPSPGSGTPFVPTQDTILSGSFSFNLNKVVNGNATGTVTKTFSSPSPFSSAPIVVATAQGNDASGNPLSLAVTVGDILPTGFRVRVTNISNSTLETVNVNFIAISRK